MKKTNITTVSEIKEYLTSKDPILGGLIGQIGDLSIKLEDDYFQALVGSIIGQQLSPKAAATIYERTANICGCFTPENITVTAFEQLRSAGLSGGKIAYMKDLAERIQEKQLILEKLPELSDDKIIERLTAVKGIGKWTAEMFMIFSLGHMDVYSMGDLGLKRAIEWLYRLDMSPDEQYLEKLTDRWKPYRTIASLYLWEAINRGLVTSAAGTGDGSAVVSGVTAEGRTFIDIIPTGSFSFHECLVYLGRSKDECTHHVEGNEIFKLVELQGEKALLKIYSPIEGRLRVEFMNLKPDKALEEEVFRYVWEWFDLGRDLKPFFKMACKDKLLKKVAARHQGLRIIGIHDIFEALVWAIAGQQINLAFAYTLKRRFVEKYGECIEYAGRTYWTFPKPEVIKALTVEELKELKFTGKKAEYILGVAEAAASGALSKELLLKDKSIEKQRKRLTAIHGIGSWTADYVIMKCIKNTAAFPTGDVGLQNAIKNLLKQDKKPAIPEIEKLAAGWKGWEAYATFYLWRTLYE